MAYIGREPQVGNFQVCDAISVVNGQAAYTMQVSSVNVSPETANHMIVSLNGIIQAPGSSYTVSGSTITFASNLVTGDVINFIHILGSVLDLGVPSDNTVSTAKIVDGAVTSAKLASGVGGKVLQRVYVESGALITASSNSIPEDDTIPQNTEGTEVMTLAITPTSATSKLHIFANMFGSHSASTRTGIALFVDTTADALAFTDSANGGATTMMNTYLQHVLTSGSTSARTYKIRMGGMASSGTLSFNGQAGARKFGGVILSSIIIMEIEA